MIYGKRKLIASAMERLNSVQPLWDLLKHLPAAPWKKMQILRQCIWSKVFYGCSNCTFAMNHIQTLRTSAIKSLRRNRAGANPLLALSLDNAMTSDPGFFQFWTVLSTFQRMIHKQPSIVDLWQSFMCGFDGRASHGPFGKLLEQLALVGWSVAVPGLYDHDGIWISLFDISVNSLRALAEDAWAQYVAKTLQSRKGFSDLVGIDLALFKRCQRRLSLKDSKILQPVQDGSFMDAKMQSKFDMAKDCLCAVCGVEDTYEHRCFHCPKLAQVHDAHQDIITQSRTLPFSMRVHLIPSRLSDWIWLKNALLQPAQVQRRPLPLGSNRLDLFTDGSTWLPNTPKLSLGAWAVVAPQVEGWVARGTLHGLCQHNDAAELQAIAEALDLSHQVPGEVTIWCDSAYAAGGVHRLLMDPLDCPDEVDSGLWTHIQNLLQHRAGTLMVQHIAAHRSSISDSSPVDSWTANWNDCADF